jgi:hypothetical protein
MPRKPQNRRGLSGATDDKRQAMAADLLTAGEPRAAVAAVLQRDAGVSRSTAYRLIRQAERTLPVEFHQLAGTAGMIDTLAEAQRHYEAALLENDTAAISKWLAMVHRFQLDTARTRPFDLWEVSQSTADGLPADYPH